MAAAIEAVLFDLGRVLVDIDMTRSLARWAQHAGCPPLDRTVMARLMASDVFHRHERGQISDAAFFDHVRGALDLALTDEQVLDGWNAIFLGEMTGIRPVLGRLAGRLPLYGFSNTNAAHVAYWSREYADLLRPLGTVFTSNALGRRKPEPDAFAAVLTQMGAAPGRVLFFDDSPANVVGARSCGLHAVEVRSVADIEEGLRAHGVL